MTDSDETQRELKSRDEEIARLRELLVAKDRELGAAKGRVAELEHYSRLVTGFLARLRALASRLAGGVLRRLPGRRGRAGA